jgi:hypothetical protein
MAPENFLAKAVGGANGIRTDNTIFRASIRPPIDAATRVSASSSNCKRIRTGLRAPEPSLLVKIFDIEKLQVETEG